MLELIPKSRAELAPPWVIDQWFNVAGAAPTLPKLQGKVLVLHAFQMLCPGCVSHGLPQAARIVETFDPKDVAVLGLHCVFEHHAAMAPLALAAFLHEYRVGFPVAVDRPAATGPIPMTMAAYELRGTPSVFLIDRLGLRRAQVFGRPSDMDIAAAIQRLVDETVTEATADDCDEQGCRVPNLA